MNRTCRRLAPSSALALVALAAIACGSPPVPPPPLPTANSITYITGSGFLIWVGDKKVLVDAVFDGYPDPRRYAPPPVVQQPLRDGKAPIPVGEAPPSISATSSPSETTNSSTPATSRRRWRPPPT